MEQLALRRLRINNRDNAQIFLLKLHETQVLSEWGISLKPSMSVQLMPIDTVHGPKVVIAELLLILCLLDIAITK